MDKANWVWMPHPAHFIGAKNCQFRIATYVGKFIVSTVGELLWDSTVREILAQGKGITLEGKGDDRKADYMKKVGYEQIGMNRLYETMVFRAVKSGHKCCPWEIDVEHEVDFEGYNDPGEAFEGHMRMCEKWAA